MYQIRHEILITQGEFCSRASDAHTLPLQRPACWMQLVLHYSCGLADLTLVELYILPSELEKIAFIVYGTRQISIRAQKVQAPCLAGWPFELWNRIMHLCWADFLNLLNRSYCSSASVYMVLHQDLQPNNPNQTCWWISIKFLTCFKSSGTFAAAGLDERGEDVKPNMLWQYANTNEAGFM